MQDKKEIQITPKQERVYQFVCDYHSTHGDMPKLRVIARALGYEHDASVKSMIDALIKRGLLARVEGARAKCQRGYCLPDERPEYTVRDWYCSKAKTAAKPKKKPKPSVPPPAARPDDEFQYIRLGIGEAATIGDVYIGMVHVETEKEVAALEVIAPASMGVLRRDVHSDLDQPQQPGRNEILLRCMEKTIDLLSTEIYRLQEAGIQPAGKE